MKNEIKITVNGQECLIPEKYSLTEFFTAKGIVADRTVVAVNGEIVKLQDTAQYCLKAGDSVDLMTFVGGG